MPRRRANAHRSEWLDRVTKPSKYRAKPTEVDNIRFASKKEAKRYAELKLLEKAGEVRRIELQPSFDLFVVDHTVGARIKRAAARMRGEGSILDGRIKVGTYRADFAYEQQGLSASENERWRRVIEDVKGFKTPVYRLKKKMVEAIYGITIREL
jgi:hypothetical protein